MLLLKKPFAVAKGFFIFDKNNKVKKIIFGIIISLGFFSCSDPEHPDATSLCNCYTHLHRAREVNDINRIADSCNTIYTKILEKYKDDQEGFKAFEEAYRICQ